jgi:T5SS/PEP-CTERM-associated repeat protein
MNSSGGVMKQALFSIAIMVGLGFISGNVLAADKYWQNTGGGDFATGANWVGGTPGTNDNANFTNDATYTVTFSSSPTNIYGKFSANSGVTTLSIGSGNEWRLTGGGDGVQFNGAGGTVNLGSGTISTADKFGLGAIAGANNSTFQIYGGALVNLNGTYSEAYLGQTGYGNVLVISNSAALLSKRDVLIGLGAGASNSTVIVSGSGSLLRAATGGSGVMIVGVQGANNELRIESGGTVSNINAYIGGGSPSGVTGGTGHFNRVTVTGGGTWTNSNVMVGYKGQGNSVTVSSNGVLYAAGYIIVGDSGSQNSFNVLDGGVVSVSHVNVGGGAVASSNSLLVSGPSAVFRARTYEIESGVSGSGNSLTIANGGKAFSGRALLIGRDLSATNNLILVTGTNSLLGGGNLSVGANGYGNELRIESFGVVTNVYAYVGGTPASSVENLGITTGHFNRVTVTSGGMWTNASSLDIGNNGQSNSVSVSGRGVLYAGGGLNVGNLGPYSSLSVLDEGAVSVSLLNVGAQASSSNNTVLISGTNAILTVRDWDLDSGYGGSGNSLTVTNGGQVKTKRDVLIGRNLTASNNLMLVTGSGSLLGGRNLSLGANGSGNELRIQNGGLVTNVNAYVGGTPASAVETLGATTGHFNRVTLTGGGLWTNSNHLYVGYNGQGNSVTISSNSTVRLGSYLFAGYAGASNTVTINSGGKMVADAHATIGSVASASGTVVSVEGAGTMLQVLQFDVSVGPRANGNTLVISNGGQVMVNRHVYVGTDISASNSGTNNSIVVGSGGLLEVGGSGGQPVLQVGTAEGNCISNAGGAFQFTYASPSIINGGSAARISVTDATVSFRAIANADVRISAAGFAMDNTKMTWGGANTFMLNGATNINNVNQTYTFQPGNPTNFARMALMNGALYRGGAVTIGSGGTLAVSNGTSTIGSSLTLQPGATLVVCVATNAANGALNVDGAVSLGGATLQVALATPPVEYTPYMIINKTSAGAISGAFQASAVDLDYAGKTYRMAVRYGIGVDNNDVALVWIRPSGSVLTMR